MVREGDCDDGCQYEGSCPEIDADRIQILLNGQGLQLARSSPPYLLGEKSTAISIYTLLLR